jgi:hypothetical protein
MAMFRMAPVPALAGLFLLSVSAAGRAAPVPASPQATARLTLVKPLTLVRQADMDFATLTVSGSGTATIDPVSGNMTVTGGLLHSAGTPSPARYAGAAARSTVVNIRVPKQPVLITRVGGTETLTVSSFTLDGQDKKVLAQQQSFSFAVGATITVPAATVEGIYSGEIDVTVQYP